MLLVLDQEVVQQLYKLEQLLLELVQGQIKGLVQMPLLMLDMVMMEQMLLVIKVELMLSVVVGNVVDMGVAKLKVLQNKVKVKDPLDY